MPVNRAAGDWHETVLVDLDVVAVSVSLVRTSLLMNMGTEALDLAVF